MNQDDRLVERCFEYCFVGKFRSPIAGQGWRLSTSPIASYLCYFMKHLQMDTSAV